MPREVAAQDAALKSELAIVPELKAKGCFIEIIASKTRLCVPVDKADQILAGLIGQAPCKELADSGGCSKISSLSLAKVTGNGHGQHS